MMRPEKSTKAQSQAACKFTFGAGEKFKPCSFLGISGMERLKGCGSRVYRVSAVGRMWLSS